MASVILPALPWDGSRFLNDGRDSELEGDVQKPRKELTPLIPSIALTRGEVNETHGDIVVEEGENRTIEDETIRLSGNVRVEENASLSFRNVTLLFNSTTGTTRSLQIMRNGSFFCYDSTITVTNRSNDFSFSVNGRLYMNNSRVSRVHGRFNDGYWGGISVLSRTNESIIKNSLVNDSLIGLNIFSSVTVTNTCFRSNNIGINSLLFYDDIYGMESAVLLEGCEFLENHMDLQMRYGRKGVVVKENKFTGNVYLECPGLELEANNFTGQGFPALSGDNMSIGNNSFLPEEPHEYYWALENSTIVNNSFLHEELLLFPFMGGGNLFRNNSFISNQTLLWFLGEELPDFDNDVDTTNTINGRPVYYLFNRTGVEINASHDPAAVQAFGCRELYLHNLSFESALGVHWYRPKVR